MKINSHYPYIFFILCFSLFLSPHPSLCTETVPPQRSISLVQADPKTPEWKGLWDQARKSAVEGQLDESASLYEKLLELKPNIEEAVWEYCDVLLRTGNLDTANSYISVLLEKEPNDENYLLTAGAIAKARKEYQRAVRYFGQVYERNPVGETGNQALEGFAQALVALGKKKQVFPLLEKLATQHPDDISLVHQLAFIAADLGYEEMGRKWFLKLLDQPEVDDSVLYRAVPLFNRPEDRSRRISLWAEYLNRHPEYLPFRENLLRAYIELNNYKGSLEQLDELITRSEEKAAYQLQAAQICIKHLNRPDLALNYYEHYLSGHPQDPEVNQRVVELRMILANDFLSIVENNGAWLLWRDLAHIAPNRIEIYRNMAALLEKEGKVEPLIEILEILAEQNPMDQENLLRLARLYQAHGRFSEALATTQRIPSKIRDSSKVSTMLEADLATILGKNRIALNALLKACSIDPMDQELRIRCLQLAGNLGRAELLIPLFTGNGGSAKGKDLSLKLAFLEAIEKNGLISLYEKYSARFAEEFGESSKENGLLLLNRAQMYSTRGSYRKAEGLLRVGLKDGLYRLDFLYQLVEVSIRQRKFEAAKTWLLALGEMVRQDLKNEDVSIVSQGERKGEMLLLNVRLLKGLGRYEEALALLERHIASGAAEKRSVPIDDYQWELEKEFCWLQFYEGNLQAALQYTYGLLHQQFDAELFALLHIFDPQGWQEGSPGMSEFLSPHGTLALVRLIDVVEQELKYRAFDLADLHLKTFLDRYPSSLRGQLRRAQLDSLTGHFSNATEEISRLQTEWSEELSFGQLHIDIALRQGKYDDALSTLLEMENSPTEDDLIIKYRTRKNGWDTLRLARILWGKGDMSQALELYRTLLSPSTMAILQETFARNKVGFVVSGKDEGFWSSMVQLLSTEPDIVEELMAPEFLLNNLDNRTGRIVANQFDMYSLQKQVRHEYVARKAIFEKNYYYAAQSYRKLPEEDRSVSTMLDLASIYGRIGKIRKEAQVYEELQSSGSTSPAIIDSLARSTLQLSPQSTGELDLVRKSGRDGSIDIKKRGVGTSFLITPALDKDLRIQYENSKFTSSDDSESLWSNRVMGEALFEIGESYELFGTLQLEKFDEVGETTPVYTLGIRGQLDDYVEGIIKAEKALVYDTPEAIRQEISREGFQVGLEIETNFGLMFGGDVDYYKYSDDNSRNRFHGFTAYRVFSDVNEWTLQYDYKYQANDGASSADGDASDFYWKPTSFFEHRFSLNFEHNLGDVFWGRGAKSYFRFDNGVGVEKDAVLTYRGAVDIFLEMSPHYLLNGNFVLSASDAYEENSASISLQYRW